MNSSFKPLIWFYALTFLLLGLIPLTDVLLAGGGMQFDEAAARATAATGVQWTSNLLGVLRLSLVEPVLLLTVLGSVVPALAAILVITFSAVPGRWKQFFGRLNPLCGIRWQTALMNYGLIFMLLLPTLLLVLQIRQSAGYSYEITSAAHSLAIIPAILSIALFDQGAVLEELGWRGFASHELQNLRVPPLTAAILVGICWGLWHLPRDITTGVIDRLGTIQYLTLYLPAFCLGTIAVSVIAVFMNRMGGSLIPAIMVHGITNDAIGLSGTASIIEALTPVHQATKNVPLACIALLLIIVGGTPLGYRGSTRPVEPME